MDLFLLRTNRGSRGPRRWAGNAAVGVAGVGLGEEGGALRGRTLQRPEQEAVFAVVVAADTEAPGRFLGEVVVRVGEVLEVRQVAYAAGNLAGELVVGHVQLLQTRHAADGSRQVPDETVVTEVENAELGELPDLQRDASPEAGAHDDELVQNVAHVRNRLGHARLCDLVAGEDQHRHRRVPDILRDGEGEMVVVEEQSIKGEFEEAGRHVAAEAVGADIEEPERG
ncbi:hypothetical protein ZIOFF_034676 [Zingiber officinale]|uniref:Uncharacterized protein n=1 Tax=Zingiber officinale TaxID=94328 RepID=A0A8J5GSG2_ZINOF|nr:hypothetical protein ZIOFF_034676 [Zingiber officinale]